jgi:hypothetical protein
MAGVIINYSEVTSLPETAAPIFQFITDSLKVAESPYNIINGELIMAQCQVQVPRTFFRPARTELTNLQMVCRPELLSKYPGSELVTQGSYRLQWFIDGIRQRGHIVKGTYPYDLDPRKIQREIKALLTGPSQFFFEHPLLSYQPYLLVNFKASLETDEKFEELYSLGINLVSGEINHQLLPALSGKKIIRDKPRKLEKRRISYRDGFEALWNHLRWMLKNHDRKWLESAKYRWEEEIGYLESYYHDREETGDQASFYRRVAETYRKYQPSIHIEIGNVALLFLPFIIYTVEPFPGQRLPDSTLFYDPVLQKIKWIQSF